MQYHCTPSPNLIGTTQVSRGRHHEITPVHLDAVEFSSTINERSVSTDNRTLVAVQPIPISYTQVRSVPHIPPNVHKSITENMEYWLVQRYWEFLSRNGTSLRELGWPKVFASASGEIQHYGSRKLEKRFCQLNLNGNQTMKHF